MKDIKYSVCAVDLYGTCYLAHCCFIGGFHVTSLPPCWWKKTKDLSLASFVRPPEAVHFSIAIGVPRGWLKTSYIESILGKYKPRSGII